MIDRKSLRKTRCTYHPNDLPISMLIVCCSTIVVRLGTETKQGTILQCILFFPRNWSLFRRARVLSFSHHSTVMHLVYLIGGKQLLRARPWCQNCIFGNREILVVKNFRVLSKRSLRQTILPQYIVHSFRRTHSSVEALPPEYTTFVKRWHFVINVHKTRRTNGPGL